METRRVFCRLNGCIEGSEKEIKKFLNGDDNANVEFFVAKEGYIPADSIEEFHNECNSHDNTEDWLVDDFDFCDNPTEYLLQ